MAIVNFENLPSENTPLTGGASGNLNVMQENGTTHGSDTKLGYSQAFLNDHIVNISNEVDEDYRVNLLKSKNLFDKDNWYKSYINPTDGSISSSNNAALFNYIKVKPSTIYSLKLDTNVLDLKVAYYTNNYTWISSSSTITTSTTITTPNNCEYIRIYINVDGNGIDQTKINNTNFMLNEGSTALPYEPYITPSIVVDNDEIYSKDNLEQYSTSEIRIGTWINGKPLYRKVIDFGALPNNTYKVVNSNISNVDKIINTNGIAIRSDKTTLPIPYTTNVELYITSSQQVSITTTSDRSAFNAYITIEYTKTTD